MSGGSRHMKIRNNLFAGVTLAALVALTPAAEAQDSGSMQVGGATVTVGGGTQVLVLPDVSSVVTLLTAGFSDFIRGFEFNEDFDDEIGANINGSITLPMGAGRTISLNGFWANVEDEDTSTCSAVVGVSACFYTAIVDDPTATQFIGPGATNQLVSKSERDVNNWSVSLDAKKYMTPDVMGVTQAPHRRYLALGADVRGIYQDLDVTFSSPTLATFNGTYDEELDTTYYGLYAAWGGDYSPFLFKGLWNRWGLRSSFALRGGVYYADTDYKGALVDNSGAVASATSSLSLSEDDVAFIGGLTLETSKRLGIRSKLTLRSDYEYYS